MPVREIKTRLTVDGEKELRKELDAAAREMRVLETGMKAAAAGFDATGEEFGKLENRSKSLHSMLEQQKEIVKSLNVAVKDVKGTYGDTSRETQDWTIRLNSAVRKQEELRKAVRDADRELDEFTRDSVKAGRELENGLGDAAEDTRRSIAQMYDEMKSGIDDIRGSVGISAAFDIGGGIVNLAQGLDSFAEGSRDYRRRMAFLKQNAETAGLDYNEIMSQYYEISGLTGESDGAIEGLSNLIAAGLDIHEVAAAVDELGGAVIRFPDTLKFESLADGLQETIATRTATGQYAELLGRLGVDLNTFNTAMAEAKTEEEAQQVALSFLANNGLREAWVGFSNANSEIERAEIASLKFETAMARVGGALDKYIIAPVKEEAADALNALMDFLETGDLGKLISSTASGELTEEEIAALASEEAQKHFAETAEEVKKHLGLTDEDVQRITEEYREGMSGAVKDGVAEMQTELSAGSAAASADFYAAGEGIMLQMAGGIAAGAGVALAQMQASMSALAAMSAVPLAGRSDYTASFVQVGAQLGSATVNLDGKQVGKAMLPVLNGMMGAQAIQAETYGE